MYHHLCRKIHEFDIFFICLRVLYTVFSFFLFAFHTIWHYIEYIIIYYVVFFYSEKFLNVFLINSYFIFNVCVVYGARVYLQVSKRLLRVNIIYHFLLTQSFGLLILYGRIRLWYEFVMSRCEKFDVIFPNERSIVNLKMKRRI